jgi:hypothetical protein
MCACMYICVRICVYVCVYMCMCVHVCIFVYMCACVYMCAHVCVYVYKKIKIWKYKCEKKSIFPFESEDSKNCQNNHRWMKSGVSFRVDTFSYKNFLFRLRMQKLWPFYWGIKFFYTKYQNSSLLFFLITTLRNITTSQVLNFLNFFCFLLFFEKLKRRSGEGGWHVKIAK